MNASKWLWLASLSLLPFLFAKNGQTQIDSVLFRTAIWSAANFFILVFSYKVIPFFIFKKIGVLSFLAYTAIAILSYLFVHFLYSPFQLEGISEIIRLINCFFSIIFSIYFIRKEEKILLLLYKLVSLQAIILSVIGIFQYMGVLQNCAEGVAPCGFLVNRNLFGSYLVLGLPFILYCFQHAITNRKTEKKEENNFVIIVFYLVGIFLILIGIYLSQTRSAYLATAFIGILYVLYFLLRIRFLYVAIVVFVVGSVSGFVFYTYSILNPENFDPNHKEKSWRDLTQTDSQAERLLLWEKTISMIKENPVLGVGFQNWKYQLPKYSLEGLRNEKNEVNVQRPHNDFLWIAAESGIITLLFYLVFITYLIYVGIKTKNILVLVVFAFLIDSVFSFPKERIVHTLILATSIGIILKDDKKLFHKNSVSEIDINENTKKKIKVMEKQEKSVTEEAKAEKIKSKSKSRNKPKSKKGVSKPVQNQIAKPKIIPPTFKAIPTYFSCFSLLVLGICFYIAFVQNRDKAKTIELLINNQSRNFAAVLPLADQINDYFVPSDYFINSVYMHKGYAHLNLNNPKAAKENYLKGLQQMPYSIALLKQMAVLYQSEKKYDSAIVYYEKMQKIIPHLPETYQQIYNNYLLKGDTTSAKEMIEKCPAPCK